MQGPDHPPSAALLDWLTRTPPPWPSLLVPPADFLAVSCKAALAHVPPPGSLPEVRRLPRPIPPALSRGERLGRKARVVIVSSCLLLGGAEVQNVDLACVLRHSPNLDVAFCNAHPELGVYEPLASRLHAAAVPLLQGWAHPQLDEADLVLWWGGGLLSRIAARKYIPGSVLVMHGACHQNALAALGAGLQVRWGVGVSHPATALLDAVRAVHDPGREPGWTIWNGVPAAPYESRPRRRPPLSGRKKVKVGYLGRYSVEKNPLAPIFAMKDLPRHVELHLWGWGDLLPVILAATAQRGVQGRVFVHETAADPVEVLNDLDLLLVPSFWDGLPMVVLEAMHAGCPVVTAPNGDLSTICQDGARGFLLPETPDPADIAEQVRGMLEDPETVRQAAQAAQAFARKHLVLRRSAQQYERLLVNRALLLEEEGLIRQHQRLTERRFWQGGLSDGEQGALGAVRSKLGLRPALRMTGRERFDPEDFRYEKPDRAIWDAHMAQVTRYDRPVQPPPPVDRPVEIVPWDRGDRPRVLLVVDHPAWSLACVSRHLMRHAKGRFDFRLHVVGDAIHPRSELPAACEVAVFLYWSAALDPTFDRIEIGKRVLYVSDYQDHLGHPRWKEAAARASAVFLVNEDLRWRFEVAQGLPTFATPSGVDTDLFCPQPFPEVFAVGWAGNSRGYGHLGYEEAEDGTVRPKVDPKGRWLIEAACKQVGVPFVAADFHDDRTHAEAFIPQAEMPARFYRRISLYVCASKTEGTPNPVLEAMACGRPVVSTRVGVVPDVVHEDSSRCLPGLIVDRSVEALAQAIRIVRDEWDLVLHGEAARQGVDLYAWDNCAVQWEHALDTVLGRASRMKAKPVRAKTPERFVRVPSPLPAHFSDAAASDLGWVPGLVPASGAIVPAYVWERLLRVLLISDVRGWAFDQNLQDLAEALKSHFTFDFWYVKDYMDAQQAVRQQGGGARGLQALDDRTHTHFESYEVIFRLYMHWPIDHLLPWDRVLGALRSSAFHYTEHNRPEMRPGDIELVNRCCAFQVVTRPSYVALRPHCPGVVYLTNPVNMARFPRAVCDFSEVRASWSGNAQHAGTDLKGFYSILQPAVKAVGVPFQVAEYHTSRLPPSEMPAFYEKANVTLCASVSEGASNSCMEALACGHVLISTPVGNLPEIQWSQIREFGESGIVFVERTPEAFAEALRQLQKDPKRAQAMGAINRSEIACRWSWQGEDTEETRTSGLSLWQRRYLHFLQRGLRP